MGVDMERRRERNREYKRRAREANPEIERDTAQRSRDKHRDELRAEWRERNVLKAVAHCAAMNTIKMTTGCADCGCVPDDPKMLHFHHLDPSTKAFEISEGRRYSKARLAAELAKCSVLCQPCHVDRHRQRTLTNA